ncbi:MAG: divergent PAP2 family protein [Gloeomargarita sp. SKYG116]|nr:divergent PAP2 family protein [Gloeomargarita sp. SKYG116]MDW8402123.1 divergent PAP2 family protein [Gloeomargarita sp. SKYGB_i_bin116]
MAAWNGVLLVALLACGLAQVTKSLIALVQQRQWHPKTLIQSGGMPSSHAALVAALAVAVGQTWGWNGPEFAIAVVVALIVMYDASGVRLAASRHARLLNQMVDTLRREHQEFQDQNRLHELLGHTPAQVLAGGLLGVMVALVLTPWLQA